MSILTEFREFALKGNVVDLAVGVIIGAAFGTIVSSLVDDMIMPLVGAATGGLDFSNYFLPLSEAVTATTLDAAKEQGAVFAYGKFITAVLKFVIVAWVLFLVIQAMNKMKRKEEAKPATVPEKPEDVQLLGEIRDLLKNRPPQ
ncbi:large conductance mechanosensitive channel protein MscL [Terricaulis sp.]|uniref:large conductance mechanosensitive channel protein MscL n=1 Tax=Terricaulis sp. TaxID=2768686 RepID=UPI002AC58E20|nr:large conductance mechanosensitive channel protein MscL [Terricaulis sp.]MDZ4691041.1 large conductance mechanosensitive channel protein MscL [Terricaulis sp.]